MMILISGSTGMIGTALSRFLATQGHSIKTLVRRTPKNPSEIEWNPGGQGPKPESLEGIEAVVHLAGVGIAEGRWTNARKKAIHDSRSVGTRLLSEALAQMKNPPRVLVSASAIGYYGDRGDERLHESSPAGQGFLPEVCKDWEAATVPAHEKGIRVVNLRIGIVLSPAGGALKQMLLPFKMGVGGNLGPGTQYMSWISLDDVLGIVLHSIQTQTLQGPVNTVSPKAVTNAEYTKILGQVLGRPTIFPMPSFAARLVFGEMADALLLASTRVDPESLSRSGYTFLYPELAGALSHLLNS